MWREVLLCSVIGLALGGSDDSGTRVAVVDLHLVLNSSKKFDEGDRAIRAWMDQQKAALRKRQETLSARKSELELFEKGSTERVKAELEVAKLALDLDYEIAAADREREDRVVAHQRDAFDAATRAIQQVARERNFDLVLQLRSGALISKTQNELSSEIFLRDVVAVEDGLDITTEVLSVLDR
jgi:Skp family chaperone for outer membrane proteins